MEQTIEAEVSPKRVWEAWEKAQAAHGHQGLRGGTKGVTQTGQAKGIRYEILDVVEGQSFSILWKTPFVRLIFTHAVEPTRRGSKIRYGFQIRGFFAWPVRWILGKKIASNLSLVLKATAKQLEAGH